MNCIQTKADAVSHPMACTSLCGKRPRTGRAICTSEVGQSQYAKVGVNTPLRPSADTSSLSQGINANGEQDNLSPSKSFPTIPAAEEGQDPDLRQALQYAHPEALAAFIVEQEEAGDEELEQCIESLLVSSTAAGVPCHASENPLADENTPLDQNRGADDNRALKRRKVADARPRTGSGKACNKTLEKRQRQIENIISRADASAEEKCCDMVAHIYKMVKQTDGCALTRVCTPFFI